MGLYRDQGVVLRTYRLGEADRIVVIATRTSGKVRAVAKGVRQTKSKFGGRLEPVSHVALQLYEGRDLDIVTQAEVIDHFRAIREDLERLTKATTLLEAVDQVAQEGEPNARLYSMLVGALRSLASHDSALLVPAFFWKRLGLEGAQPIPDECASCGAAAGDGGGVELVAFDLADGGTLCRNCRRGMPISADALELIRRILGGDLAAVLRDDAGPVAHDVGALATRALEFHLERRLRSPGVLDRA
jgi:DNA repair protein RecO (recombination protein O)